MSIQSSKIALRATSDSEEVRKVTSTSFEAANRITGCDRWQNCGRRFDSTHQCRIEVAADESTNVTGVRLERPLWLLEFYRCFLDWLEESDCRTRQKPVTAMAGGS